MAMLNIANAENRSCTTLARLSNTSRNISLVQFFELEGTLSWFLALACEDKFHVVLQLVFD